jgi:hypothetical protein
MTKPKVGHSGLTSCPFQRFPNSKRLVPSCGKVEHCEVCAPLSAANILRHEARMEALERQWEERAAATYPGSLFDAAPVTEVLQ